MTSKLTRERIEQYANDPRMCNINDEIREMARMALTAMDSDPVIWGAPKTVKQLIRQLQTLDPDLETTALLRMPANFRDGNAIRQVPISISYERMDGQWLAPYQSEHRKVLAFWAKPDDRNAAERGEVLAPQPAPVVDCEPVADVVAWSHPTEERTCDIRWRRHDVGPGPLYRHAQPAPVVPDDVQRDAKRWRALLGSARIRILGSAGFDATAHPGENPDYRHFGMEIWTHYPNWLHEKNEYGIDTLTQYADAMLAAAPQEVR